MSKSKRETDEKLEDALEMTFPASDPVSIGGDDASNVRRADRQPAALDKILVEGLSRQVKKRASSRTHH